MKKLILGIALMAGTLGATLLFGKPAVYNGVSGWLGCFLDRAPFTVFVAVALGPGLCPVGRV